MTNTDTALPIDPAYAADLPVYPYQVGGTDVYDAVFAHGVRTPEGFDAYLRERGLPGR